jgi:hypothetical protein
MASTAHWVEHQLSIRGGGVRVQAQAKLIYLNLGSLHHKMNIQVCKICRAFRKIKSR